MTAPMEKPPAWPDEGLWPRVTYERARATAAISRLRLAGEALQDIMELEQGSSTSDTLEVAAEALALIGELPKE